MTDTTVTIQLQISHNVDVIELITESYPDITIGAENPGFDTDLTGTGYGAEDTPSPP